MYPLDLILIGVLIVSLNLFYGLAYFMAHEVKVNYSKKNSTLLLLLSGLWVFSESIFKKGRSFQFKLAKFLLVLISICIIILIKRHI